MMNKRRRSKVGKYAFRFVLTIGIINLFAALTYEGGQFPSSIALSSNAVVKQYRRWRYVYGDSDAIFLSNLNHNEVRNGVNSVAPDPSSKDDHL
jgi:hypothetical protein